MQEWGYEVTRADIREIHALDTNNQDDDAHDDFDELMKYLKMMGRRGWELMNVLPIIKDGSTSGLVYFFKKPKE